jgi:hypothetical protein
MRINFHSIKGVAYKVLSHQGDVYMLTSDGFYILGQLDERFANGELTSGIVTPILKLPMATIDMTLAGGRWLLIVMDNEVRKYDADKIHEYVVQHIARGDLQEVRGDIVLNAGPEFGGYDSKSQSALMVA